MYLDNLNVPSINTCKKQLKKIYINNTIGVCFKFCLASDRCGEGGLVRVF